MYISAFGRYNLIIDRLIVKRRGDLEHADIEAMWLEIRAQNNVFLLCVIYRPPNGPGAFWDNFQEMLDVVKQDRLNNLLILGDLNADNNTRDGAKFKFFTDINHLTSHIDEPTRITTTTQTRLDRIISNMPHLISKSEVLEPLLYNDHCTISVSLSFRIHKGGIYKRLMWDYSRANFNGLREYLSNIDWSETLGYGDDIELAASKWSDIILTSAKRYIPTRTVIIRPNDKGRVGRRHKHAKTSNDAESWAEFRHIRNEYIQSCRDAEKLYDKRRIERLSQSSFSTKECWSLYKSVLGINSQSSYPSLNDRGNIVVDDASKANVFNQLFVNNATIDDTGKELPVVDIPLDIPTIEHIDITLTDVRDQLSTLNPSKSYGPDGVGPRLLKELKQVVAPPLLHLFKESMRQRKVPGTWKQANVVPLYKKGDKSDPNNYRPVSLLNTTSKLMEKVVFKYLFNFFRDNFLLSLWQSGFMPGCSTICQLTEIYHKWCKAVSDGKEVRVVFLDISRAFDRVWHSGLIHKLRTAGVRGELLIWLQDYLRGRQQRVCINGQYSQWADILAGVPQGSVLGPLLFLVFINDLTHIIRHTQIRLFADDTCLFITVDNRDLAKECVNDDLEAINKWSNDWLVTFSVPKTKAMIISKKLDRHLHTPVSLNNTLVDDVSSHKHLGLFLSNNLSWISHIDEIYLKAMKRLDTIHCFKFKLDRASLERFYLSYVLPILEYGDIVWSGAYDRELSKLDQIHVRAMRIITGATERSHIAPLYEDLGWHRLSTRRKIHRLKWFYKIINGISPQYLTDLVPPTVGERQRYNLRGAGNISQITTNKQCYLKSYFPATIKEWNVLPEIIRESPTLATFTKRLNCHFAAPTKKSWFNFGGRFLNIHHTRMRLGCSKLKAHLHFDLHVEDDPSCRCGQGVEDPFHFLFVCPLYTQHRLTMLDSISRSVPDAAPRLSLLLRGDTNLSVDENNIIFCHVHEFINVSGRFANE